MDDPRFDPLPPDFFRQDAESVAQALLGRFLVRQLPPAMGSQRLVLRLVETEAYLGEPDAASHARRGPATARSRRLYRDGGHAYVYLIYGLYHCLNVVTGSAQDGSAVLLRGGAPVTGLDAMARMRGRDVQRLRPGEIAGGPGKLCQAMAIGGELDGVALWEGELFIAAGEPAPASTVARGPRIGVDYAGEAARWPLRFGIRGNREMSRPVL